MNSGSVNPDKGLAPGGRINRRREVSVAEMKSRLGQEEPDGKSLYGYAIENGFFRLGLLRQVPELFQAFLVRP